MILQLNNGNELDLTMVNTNQNVFKVLRDIIEYYKDLSVNDVRNIADMMQSNLFKGG